MISIGTIGLIKAVTTFDESKGARLATYAARCVENVLDFPTPLSSSSTKRKVGYGCGPRHLWQCFSARPFASLRFPSWQSCGVAALLVRHVTRPCVTNLLVAHTQLTHLFHFFHLENAKMKIFLSPRLFCPFSLLLALFSKPC